MTDQHEQTAEDITTPTPEAGDDVAVSAHQQVDRKDHEHKTPDEAPADLTPTERELLADLFAIVEEHA